MDPKLTAEILKTCESIGFADGDDKYISQPDWDVCVKDLILYLRRDDDDHTIRRLLGQAQVVGRDLLPLFKHYNKEDKVWEIALRLVVNLTHPTLLLYGEDIPKNKKYLNYYHILEGHLRTYKEAFVDKALWKTLAEKLRQLLNLEWDKRMEQDKLTIERILILVRNILYVPADPTEERRADDDTSLHDRILMVMHLSGFMDLLLFIASSETTQEYSILILEIMYWMLREQTGEQLAKTQLARNEDDKVKDERELIRMREKEAVLKSIQLQKLPSRHSRFGGTFVVRDMKAPSGRDIICHKPIASVADLSLDSLKKRKKVASNRKPINEEDGTRRSTIPVRIILKDFCAAFLDGKYNTIISIVKDSIIRDKNEDNDETYYLWGLKFFMEFNRHHQFCLSNVRETMSTNTFHYVQRKLDDYQGMMVTEKEKIPFWSRRAHMALKAYQELLFTLLWMDKDGDESVRDSSRSIKNNVFYLPEYRELCLSLLNTYDPLKLSKLYLKDLIETNHLFLKMLEDYSSQNRRIMIKCKAKRKKSTKESKNRKKARKGPSASAKMSSSELEEAWAKASGEISLALLSTELPNGETEAVASTSENVIPFDAASDIPIDEQKGTAVERIAVFLHTGKYKEAVLLLRSSREVWPTDVEFFGPLECDPSDEEELLKSMFMEKASLMVVREARYAAEHATSTNGDGVESTTGPVDEKDYERAAVFGEDDEEEEEDEEEQEEEQRVADIEQEFDFKGFLLKYAMARVVCNYALLFQDWDTLKPLTLHCIMKMFHRFVFDMGYPALICQASLFLTFKKILQVCDKRSDLREVKQFFLHFWPKFAKLCENKKMFIEILFWKTAREAQEIQDNYAELRGESSGKKKKKSDWTNDEDNELELLVELYRDSPEEVKKAQKLIDFIMERWTWRPRSKRMFTSRLMEKELVGATEFAKKKRPPKTWSEEEITKLRELYEEHKDSDDIMNHILTHMEVKRSRKAVVQKMLEIGLIEDKNEVKKRGKRSKAKSRSQVAPDSDSDNESRRREGMESSGNREDNSASSSSSSDSSSDSESDREGNDSSDDDRNDVVIQGIRGPYDEEKVVSLGKNLLAKDMSVAIRWVKQSLKYYLEDIIEDPDSDESVPLVPIDAECILAIGNMDFKIFLKQLGILPPGEQETYWRIPSTFKKRDVELRLEGIEKVLTESAGTNGIISTQSSEVSNKGTRSKKPDFESDDSDNDDKSSTVSKPSVVEADRLASDTDTNAGKKKFTKGRVVIDSDSESSSDSETNSTKLPDHVPEPASSDFVDKSENESVVEKNGVTSNMSTGSPDPDLDSDSNDENDFGVVLKKKRLLIIDSDSDDE